MKHVQEFIIPMTNDIGRDISLDEETLPYHGPSADLKQNCSKFKATGDGEASPRRW